MTDQNPYQPPAVIVEDVQDAGEQGNFIPEGRSVGADRGVSWITEGFRMALGQFGPWVLITIVLFAILVVCGMIPLVGFFSNALLPVFVGGILIGARRQASGGAIEIGDLFAGFKEKFGPLVIVGLLTLVVTFVLMLVLFVPIVGFSLFGAITSGNESAIFAALGAMALFAIPLFMLLGAVITACWWLAPALIVFHDVPPVEAMKRSFIATLKNWAPALIYGILGAIALFVGSLLLLIGLLVVMPALTAATYLAYRDIFIEA